MNDEPIVSALRAAVAGEFADVPEEDVIVWDFSPVFQQRMAVLLKQERSPLRRRSAAPLRRALLVAALIALLVSTTLSIAAYHEPFYRFFAEHFGDHFSLSFGVDRPGDVQPDADSFVPYLPAYIPEGFEQTEFSIVNDAALYAEWHAPNGAYIVFNQSFVGGDYAVDTDHTTIRTVELNGSKILITENADYFGAIWANDCYEFHLDVFADTTIDEVISIIESLTAQ